MTGNKSTIGMGSIAVLIVSLYLFCLSLSKEEPIIRKKLNKTRIFPIIILLYLSVFFTMMMVL